MRRAQLGDVYVFLTERGYRIIHWAYYIEKQGKFVRIFPGFYPQIPDNIEEIVGGECAYMMCFDAPKAYRRGFFTFVKNCPVSDKYPFPNHVIVYRDYGTYGEFEVCEFDCHQHFEIFRGDPTGKGLPKKYQELKLINGIVDPIWFVYLLSSDFDLHHWDLFVPGALWDEYDKKYGDMIFGKRKEKA